MTRAMSALALLGLVSATHSQARADAVNAPPEDCAPGAVGRTSHSGQWCAPTTCTTDADCTPANIGYQRGEHRYACRDAALCVQDETYVPGGRNPDRTPRTRPVARGACVGGGCAAPARCERAMRCVDVASATPGTAPAWPPTPVPGPSTPGVTPPAGTSARPCCAATPWATERAGGAAGMALGAVLAFVAVARRRRRRPPPLG